MSLPAKFNFWPKLELDSIGFLFPLNTGHNFIILNV